MVEKGGIEYGGVWSFKGKFYVFERALVTDWESTGKQLDDGEQLYDEVRWVDPEPWRGEQYWCLKDARTVARRLTAREDVNALRLISFNRDNNGVLTITDIVEIETQYNRNKYQYGSGVDRFLKEGCESTTLFSFEIVADGLLA